MYIPKDVADKAPIRLLERGIYNFEVANAEDQISKSKLIPDSNGDLVEKGNNPMIKLTHRIWDENGKEYVIWDYLVDLESMWFKSKHFLQAVGATYEDVDLKAIHCIGKSGRLMIEVQKDKEGKYPDKNVVTDYISLTNTTPNSSKPVNEHGVVDDELNFGEL